MKKLPVLLVVLLLLGMAAYVAMGTDVYAAGDLVVNGNLTVSGTVNGNNVTSTPTGTAIPVSQANGKLASDWIQLYPTTQNVYTQNGPRAFGTVYQNTTGRPMMITLTASATAYPMVWQMLSDSSNPPTTVVATPEIGAGGMVTATTFVLPNHFYKAKITMGNAVVTQWTEWY